MLVIGLTGGLGTGKTEAALYMESLGAALINADQVGHEAYSPIRKLGGRSSGRSGRASSRTTGEIDRRSLGAIVFSDPAQLARLNGIMHPLMAGMVRDKITGLRGEGVGVVVVEAALLFEAGWDSLVEEVWVTDSPEEAVIQRLSQRNGMTEEEARKRVSSQMDRAERLDRADFVIDNSSDVEAMQAAIDGLWDSRVKERAGRS